MRRLLLIAMAAAALACGPEEFPLGLREYQNSDLVLGAAHEANDLCVCAFVMGMPDDWCIDYTRATPDVAKFTIDHAQKTVSASALIMWVGDAHYTEPHFGCVLQ